MFSSGKRPGSVDVGQSNGNGGNPRRGYVNPKKLVDGNDADIPTVFDITKRAARLFPNQNGLGYRDLIKEHVENKEVTKMVKGKEVKEQKEWKYFELSDYKYMNYKEVLDDVLAVGSGLRALGLEKGKTFNIYATTS